MVTRLMIQLGVKHIFLAGFDGYSYDVLDNYMDGPRVLMTKKAMIDATNRGMAEEFRKMSKEIKLEFLTPPTHLQINL